MRINGLAVYLERPFRFGLERMLRPGDAACDSLGTEYGTYTGSGWYLQAGWVRASWGFGVA